MSLAVNEIFGPTIQGEGPSAGRRAMFLRLARCNLDCGVGEGATWACDTPYTWDWRGRLGVAHDPGREVQTMDEPEVLALITDRAPLVVITGGEPMLQARSLAPLVAQLVRQGHEVEIETNGTRPPGPLAELGVAFNVSPKLSGSGVERERAIHPEILATYRALGARFKFVTASPADLDEVAEVVDLIGCEPTQVWVMPAGTDHDTLTIRSREFADRVVAEGWNLTGRLHVALWGDRRGV